MRILILNPPHESIGSRMPGEMLPPLGLLAIGGPLIDDGHDVRLIDGDVNNLAPEVILDQAIAHAPDAVLIGHNGSTSAHPTIVLMLRGLRHLFPKAWIIYGGVFPTYHWRECLEECPEVDVIVRGEGEETARRLMRALEQPAPQPFPALPPSCPSPLKGEATPGSRELAMSSHSNHRGQRPLPPCGGETERGVAVASISLDSINGIAFRRYGEPFATPPAPMIQNLDAYRIGWELIDHARYSYYGGKRGVVVQFSRGCPHLCSYCGQRGFWTRWRHRDPKAFAAELGRLHREHGVTMISWADENPTTSKKVWREVLEAIIALDIKVTMIATLRASDIVRDADILHLYRKAGFERFLIGMEHTDEATLAKVRKGSTTKTDRQAIQLLRRHGILSLSSYVVGFEDETDADYFRALRQLIAYDPDQIITLYVTPHRWTPFFREARDRRVIQTDRKRWDYKNQVLANCHMPAWRIFLWIKCIEVLVQTRPKALARTYFNRDPAASHGMRWYSRIGKRVWLHEIWWFLFRDRRVTDGPTLEEFWGTPGDAGQEAMAVGKREKEAA